MHSLCVVLRGRKGRDGRRYKDFCSVNNSVERHIASAMDSVEMIGWHTHTHTHTHTHVRSLWSFSALRKVMNGVCLTVGQLRSVGIAHSVVLMTQSHSLKVPRWRRWATTIGAVNVVDVPAMVRAARAANKEHAQQALDTTVDLLEVANAEPVQIDGSIPPGFGDWRLKGVKTAWFAKMAPTDRHDLAVWPALWKTNVPSITHESMYERSSRCDNAWEW